jgi:hypothetical protein
MNPLTHLAYERGQALLAETRAMRLRGQIANMLAAEILGENAATAWLNNTDAWHEQQDIARVAYWDLYDDPTFTPELDGERRARRLEELTGLERLR